MSCLWNFILLLTIILSTTVCAVAEVPSPVARHSGGNLVTVTLTIDVVNGTASGSAVAGDKAFITIFHGNEQTGTMEAIVDSAGMAVFKDIHGDSHYQIVPRVQHDNITFGGAAVRLDTAEKDIRCSVEVYDVSLDSSVITVGTHHLILNVTGESLVVTEFMQLINPTDKAVSSSNVDADSKPKVITVSLPSGFKELKFLQYFVKSAMVETEDSFYDTMSIPPGSFDAMFTYKLDLINPVMDIQKVISMATEEFTVFSQLESKALHGAGESAGDYIIPDGSKVVYYAPCSYKAGDDVLLQITENKLSQSDKPIAIIVAGIFVLALVLLFAIKKLSKR